MVMETRVLMFGVLGGVGVAVWGLRVLEVVAQRESVEEEHSSHEHLEADQQVLDSLHNAKKRRKKN